jgi:hypothetical protein
MQCASESVTSPVHRTPCMPNQVRERSGQVVSKDYIIYFFVLALPPGRRSAKRADLFFFSFLLSFFPIELTNRGRARPVQAAGSARMRTVGDPTPNLIVSVSPNPSPTPSEGDARHWSLCLGTLSGACAGLAPRLAGDVCRIHASELQSWKAGLDPAGQCGLGNARWLASPRDSVQSTARVQLCLPLPLAPA